MSDTTERAQDRLENLEAIEPLVASLRILALSNMQMAQNRLVSLRQYKSEFEQVLGFLIGKFGRHTEKNLFKPTNNAPKKLLVVLGTDRGLCGAFNKNLIPHIKQWESEQTNAGEVMVYGHRLSLVLKQDAIPHTFQGSLSRGALPDYGLSRQFMDQWIADFRSGSIQSLEVLSHRQVHQNSHKPFVSFLIPLDVSQSQVANREFDWPEPIIEADPVQMAQRTSEHLMAIQFYELILQSLIAENAVRFSLMEEARGNARELIETLSLELQIQKRQKITQQIQELSVGAGLISSG